MVVGTTPGLARRRAVVYRLALDGGAQSRSVVHDGLLRIEDCLMPTQHFDAAGYHADLIESIATSNLWRTRDRLPLPGLQPSGGAQLSK